MLSNPDSMLDATKIPPEKHVGKFIGEQSDPSDRMMLRRWRGGYYTYGNGRYVAVTDEDVKNAVTVSIGEDHQNVTVTTVNNSLLQVQAQTALSSTREPHTWIQEDHEGRHLPSNELVCMRDKIVHLPSAATDPNYKPLDATPSFFSLNATEFDFVSRTAAGEATRWLSFLNETFGDPQQIKTLQQWFGYCLTQDTRQQKILAMIGDKRSGKGTTARIASSLIGNGNVASPTMSSFGQNFGLQSLIGKQLAIIPDARFGAQGIQRTVERLLSISGEDSLDIDRKHKDPWTGRLKTRLMILSNELPRLSDASGALASRMIVLTTRGSCFGREDFDLEEKLLAELPAIFWWAVDGLASLNAEKRLFIPQSSVEQFKMLERLSSNEKAFVEDCCELGSEHWESKNSLYKRFGEWCEEEGVSHKPQKSTFIRNLNSAFSKEVKAGRKTSGMGERIHILKGIRTVENKTHESPF